MSNKTKLLEERGQIVSSIQERIKADPELCKSFARLEELNKAVSDEEALEKAAEQEALEKAGKTDPLPLANKEQEPSDQTAAEAQQAAALGDAEKHDELDEKAQKQAKKEGELVEDEGAKLEKAASEKEDKLTAAFQEAIELFSEDSTPTDEELEAIATKHGVEFTELEDAIYAAMTAEDGEED